MGSTSKTIVWFRRDLRIEDNPALAAAARDGCVLPVYIWCPKEEGQFYPGRVSRWWLKQSLAQLDQTLRSLGSGLVLIKAETTLAALLRCIGAIGATRLVFNHLYVTAFIIVVIVEALSQLCWGRLNDACSDCFEVFNFNFTVDSFQQQMVRTYSEQSRKRGDLD